MEKGLNEAKLRSSRARDLNQDTRAGELELKKLTLERWKPKELRHTVPLNSIKNVQFMTDIISCRGL